MDAYVKFRQFIERHMPKEKQMPAMSGERGYSNPNWDRTHLSEQEQAEYLTRMSLTNQHQGVDISVWYDRKNDGTSYSVAAFWSSSIMSAFAGNASSEPNLVQANAPAAEAN